MNCGSKHCGIAVNLKGDRYTFLTATLSFHKVHFIPKNKAVPSALGEMVINYIKHKDTSIQNDSLVLLLQLIQLSFPIKEFPHSWLEPGSYRMDCQLLCRH